MTVEETLDKAPPRVSAARRLARLAARLRRPPSWVGPVATLTIFAASLAVIHAELATTTFRDVEHAVGETPAGALLAAIGFAALSYAALIVNEGLALRAIGKPQSFRQYWRPAFVAYALGNAIGFSFATAPAARARLYGKSLEPDDIAALSGVTGLIVALSGAAVAGAGLFAGADEIASAAFGTPVLWRVVGLSMCAPALLWISFSAMQRPIALGGFSIAPPSLGIGLGQFGMGCLDWIAAAGALYLLMPEHGGWSPTAFAAVFVVSGFLGAASGAPGGAGVFEAGLLALAPAAQHAPAALAALLAYRLIYTIIPLSIGAVLVAIDVATAGDAPAARALRRTGGVAVDLAPKFFSAMTFISGFLLLASSATPALAERLGPLLRIAPLFVVEASHFMASIVAVLLLIVAAGLWRKSQGAYWAALLLLILGAGAALLKGFDYEEALILIAAAAALAPSKRAFTRRSRLVNEPLTLSWALALLAAVGAAGWLGFFAYRHIEYRDELWWTFLRDADASRFMRAAAGVGIVAAAASFRMLMAPPRVRWRGRPASEDLNLARAAIAGADEARSDAHLALLGDKDLLFSPSGKSFIMFRVKGRRWIAMSEPCGLRSEHADLIWSFVEAADEAGAAAVFYSVSEKMLPSIAEIGFAARKIGETAIIPVQSFTLEGKARANLRATRNRIEKESDIFFEVLAPGSAGAVADQIKRVSNAWLARHAGTEKSFSLGRFDVAYLGEGPIAVVRRGADIVAFANLWATRDKKEISIDLMRYADAAPKNVMDYLFVKLIEWAKQEGYQEFDLGMAPLAGLEDRRLAPTLARVGSAVFEEAESVYGFQGLRDYKDKFHPDWRPLYIAAPPSTMLSAALLDVALLTSGGWRGLASR